MELLEYASHGRKQMNMVLLCLRLLRRWVMFVMMAYPIEKYNVDNAGQVQGVPK